MQLIDCTREIHDFADTAAMISHLDLIITVDTAVAHLAGAMGQPVWVLLPFRSDWRWLETRPNSPWYPSMRLFRQKGDGNWDEVISRVVDALVDLRSEPTPQPGFWRRLLFQPLVALYTRLRTSFLPT
jgi:ADP-heptose:LPS heptosyltransferase